MFRDRVRCKALWDRVVSADEAAMFIKDGMTVGMSGFTRSGEAKAVPIALATRAIEEELKISLMTGASLSSDLDKTLAEKHVLARRMPFQSDPFLRKMINSGDVMYIDQHLSHTVEQLRTGQIPPVDVAIVEALSITSTGGIIPTTSVGNTASFAILADKVIVEVNMAQPEVLEGVHDIYIPTHRPHRMPIPIDQPESRPGVPYIDIPSEKIVAIVATDKRDNTSAVQSSDDDTGAIAGHLIEFLKHEIKKGRMTNTLQPLQAGVGTIANAVLHGFVDSPFHDLTMYAEVLQDSTFELLDSGKLTFASGSSFTLSEQKFQEVMANFGHYKSRLVLRPQEISNHPEVIRRLGVVGINTALEFDIYGNVNSTHVMGTNMMNGIGGSGDFARNAYMSIFVTKSTAKNGLVSSAVPMVSHVDHTEHDVGILVTEHGIADLRGLAPRERAPIVINNCAHPSYREALMDYYKRAVSRGGHTPHILEEALSWHINLRDKGRMLA